ncbi:MAG: hypothetical protein A2512_01760 [Deltaproteobacteria bacterium RIFOXYD12_FULL_56_24]|nr:MAG: hypothetical protein A2512_01760 [Deltaproteobacteria bacterium RIFOXYD12_FULL_56_24]
MDKTILQRVTTGTLPVKFISKGKRSNFKERGNNFRGHHDKANFKFWGPGKGDLKVEKNVVLDEENWESRAAVAVFWGGIWTMFFS